MDKYVEALAATSFDQDGNIYQLAVPVLCNLCLCCLQLNEWHKCILFADQALSNWIIVVYASIAKSMMLSILVKVVLKCI
jgi:hypothetical protein